MENPCLRRKIVKEQKWDIVVIVKFCILKGVLTYLWSAVSDLQQAVPLSVFIDRNIRFLIVDNVDWIIKS